MTDECAGNAPPESWEETFARLLRFYNVDSVEALVMAQNSHIEKLQERQRPSLSNGLSSGRPNNLREG